MKKIFVNLKRFEVSRELGGVCPERDPIVWIRSVVQRIMDLGLSSSAEFDLVFLLPEALIPAAIEEVGKKKQKSHRLEIGCQGVHWEDIKQGGNFGAFTSLRPAAAMVNLGCTWAILGHSEERKAKYQLLATYDRSILTVADKSERAVSAVSQMIQEETCCAFDGGLDVLVCIGENQREHGEGTLSQVVERVEITLRQQLLDTLAGVSIPDGRKLVVGYEPIWAIGPGKIPPDKHYIEAIANSIKRVCERDLGFEVPVVYGGGLKVENAREIGSISSIDGGLVALTKFSGAIGFFPEDLSAIVKNYLSG